MSYVLKVSAVGGEQGDTLTFSSRPMFGGEKIAVGDELFIWSAESAGGEGLAFEAQVAGIEHSDRRIRLNVRLGRPAYRPFGIDELAPFRDSEDGTPIAGLARKLYRQSHNKLAALTPDESAFLSEYFQGKRFEHQKGLAERTFKRWVLSLPLLLVFGCAATLALWISFSPSNGPERLRGQNFVAPVSRTVADVSSPAKSSPLSTNATTDRQEQIQSVRGMPPELVALFAIDDAGAIDAVRTDILSTGYDCLSVKNLWGIRGLSNSGANIFKADCGRDGKYQITILNGKELVKPWTGVILGD